MAAEAMQKAELTQSDYAMVTAAEVEAAALAIAHRMGRLFGAAKPEDKKAMREAARAGLYAAAVVRFKQALKNNSTGC